MARTERQGATFSSAAVLLMAFAGGSFVPLGSMPAAVRSIAPISPLYWATDGYRALIQEGAGLTALWVHVLVLGSFGVLLLTGGAWLLDRGIRAGRTA